MTKVKDKNASQKLRSRLSGWAAICPQMERVEQKHEFTFTEHQRLGKKERGGKGPSMPYCQDYLFAKCRLRRVPWRFICCPGAQTSSCGIAFRGLNANAKKGWENPWPPSKILLTRYYHTSVYAWHLHASCRLPRLELIARNGFRPYRPKGDIPTGCGCLRELFVVSSFIWRSSCRFASRSYSAADIR